VLSNPEVIAAIVVPMTAPNTPRPMITSRSDRVAFRVDWSISVMLWSSILS